jgi:hypothetical protein
LVDGGLDGSCQLPDEMIECSVDVGCAAHDAGGALVCTPGFVRGGQQLSLCVYSCASTADCPTLWTNCQTFSDSRSYCFYNYCAGSAGPFFVACNSAGDGDGQCLPSVPYPNPAASQASGICAASGTASTNGPCNPERTDAGMMALCPFGTVCQVGVSGSSACFQVNAGYCGPTGTMVAASSPSPPIFSGPPHWVLCLTRCDGGSGSCPTGQACMPVDAGAGDMGCFVP